jgi:riboflavin biosynthesis pyrimidine reductase
MPPCCYRELAGLARHSAVAADLGRWRAGSVVVRAPLRGQDQALVAGLADEVVLHVVPKLVGRGVRLFGAARADLRCTEAIQGEGALHLRYQARLLTG